jgi:hypothetical protein
MQQFNFVQAAVELLPERKLSQQFNCWLNERSSTAGSTSDQ